MMLPDPVWMEWPKVRAVRAGERRMQRVTITIDEELVAEIDQFMAARGYANRSEAIRDLSRSGLQQAAHNRAHGHQCLAALIYVYDHEKRELAQRLTRDYHEHHNLAQATLHVHLDHESCLEVTILKGRGNDVQELADHVIAERGVRHGQVVFLPAVAHSHGQAQSNGHARARPRNRKIISDRSSRRQKPSKGE
jgi:CopG family nickel-responsive transcriptional regulator